MRPTTLSQLCSLSRYSVLQRSTQLFLRIRIGLVIPGLLLLVGGAACTVTPPPQAGSQTVRFAVIGDYGGSTGLKDPLGTTQCVSADHFESAVATLVKSWNPA